MNQYKVVLIGDVGVGKSSLLQKLRSLQLHQEYKPTVGVACTYFAFPNNTHLYVLDASGSPTYQHLTQINLRNLDAVVLSFALNDPNSLQNLKEWNQKFTKAYEGDPKDVPKYVLGTKLDVQSLELQQNGQAFAESIGAKFHITSSITGINVEDFFADVSEELLQRKSSVFESRDDCDSGKLAPLYVKDVLMDGSILVKTFIDPILLDTSEEEVSYLKVEHEGIFFINKDKTFAWRPSINDSCCGFVADETASYLKSMTVRQNSLLRALEIQEPVSVWQHGWLENVYEVGAAVRRQPTVAELKGIQDMVFCSRTKNGLEKKNGIFYMIQLTDDNNFLESGLNFPKQLTSKKTDIVQNHFVARPKLVQFQDEIKATSISLTNGEAVVALEDGSVLSLGCNLLGGSFEVDRSLPEYFGFGEIPTPVRLEIEVTQVACGLDFVLMLAKDGKVFSRSSSECGCLGHGRKERCGSKERSEPKVINRLKCIKSIAAGYHHALALDSYGTLYSWGLSAGTVKTVSKPKPVYAMSCTTVVSIACGAFHSVCIGEGYAWKGNFRKRSIFSWGLGTNGALGHLVNQDVPEPRLVLHIFNKPDKLIKSVSAGRNHTAFLTDDGMVYTCGMNTCGQLGYFTEGEIHGQPKKVELGKNDMGIETRAESVICTEDCTMVTTEEKRVMVWGKFSYGPNTYDPVPLQNNSVDIVDVTTCIVPENKGKALCELIFALASGSRMVLCTGVTSGASYDYQDLPWSDKAIFSCDVSNLVRIVSVGAMVLALDNKNVCYYGNVQNWVENLVGKEVLSSSQHRIMYDICCAMEKLEPQKIPALTFKHLKVPYQIFQIEASLNSFLLLSEIGDVFSWSPYQGSPVHQHNELDDRIVVQIGCGMQHFAALTNTGLLFTCGVGCHAQLGHGDLKNRNTFEMIPLCEFEKIKSVSCGQVSTAVISESGKVYFWGQLQISKEEKQHEERMLLNSMKTFTESSPSLCLDVSTAKGSDIARCYKVSLGKGGLILEGMPFEFNIEHHPTEGVSPVDPSVVFRVQAVSSTNTIILKGSVEFTQPNTFRSSVTFPKEEKYDVSVTCNGNEILGSPFVVDVEKEVFLSTIKMTLIGCDIDSLRSVASTLTTLYGDGQEGSPSLKFPLPDIRVQLWGHPPVHGDQMLSDIVALSSLSDGGVYLYVWDGSLNDFPEQNFTFWLHQIAVKAPQAQVIILGVNMSLEQTHRFDLKAYQKSNPNLTKAIFVASLEAEPVAFSQEIQKIVGRRILSEPERMVSSKLIPLENRIRDKIIQGTEIMSRKEFVCLANECGIKDESRIYASVVHLQKVGLVLNVGAEDVFLVLNQYWLTRQLSEMIRCCPRGAVDMCHLDQQKVQLSGMLIKKKLAFTNGTQTRLFFVPCFTSDDVTTTDEPSFVVTRHLVLGCPPSSLDVAFPLLSTRLCREHVEISFGPFFCVIHDETFKCRVDFGPCLINKNKSEVRFTVSTEEDQSLSNHAASLLQAMGEYLRQECPHLYIDAQVHISCNHCFRYYFPLEAIKDISAGVESILKCGECRATIVGSDLLEGFKIRRQLPKLMERAPVGFIPERPLLKSFSSRQIVPRLVHYMNQQEERILNEMSVQFETMAKFFSDQKYDVPRTFCLLPVFEEESRTSGGILDALKYSLLLYKQQKFRLYLLCEGNGDGTGVHFLEPSKHKGYEITGVNEFVLKFVGQLRNSLQMLMQLLQNIKAITPLLKPFGYGSVFLTSSAFSAVLGFAASKMKDTDLYRYFTQVDKFLKGFQETAKTIKQPKHLGACSKDQVAYKTSGCDYEQLRAVIKSFEAIDQFGGLTQEIRKGSGGVWVCEEHAMYTSSMTETFGVPDDTPTSLKKSADLKNAM